mmetsp:Transcript_53601/g.106666  ORF Transcript_53601/g.106666 Transcript_53601/m.106666 type:complete len:214 (-) Transcript_53601:398-1039(-)
MHPHQIVDSVGSLSTATASSCQSAVPPSKTQLLSEMRPLARSAASSPAVTGPCCCPLSEYHQSVVALLRTFRSAIERRLMSVWASASLASVAGVKAEAAKTEDSGGKHSVRLVMRVRSTWAAAPTSASSSLAEAVLAAAWSGLQIVGAKTRATLAADMRLEYSWAATEPRNSTRAKRLSMLGCGSWSMRLASRPRCASAGESDAFAPHAIKLL